MLTRPHWMLVAALGIHAAACSSDSDTPVTAEDTTAADTTTGDSAGQDAADGEDVPATDDTTGDAGEIEADTADQDTTAPVGKPVFAFGTDPTQTVSAGPFPNDLYRGADGKITIAALDADPTIGPLAKATSLASLTAHANERSGFGCVSPTWFFTNQKPDMASLAGHVRILVLSGPEAGRTVKPRFIWSTKASALGIMADYGDYLMPESTYAIELQEGITNEAGDAFEAAPGVARALADTDPGGDGDVTALRAAFKPLRDRYAVVDETASKVIAASVFTTETVLDRAQAVLAGVDAFTLAAPRLDVRYDEASSSFEAGAVVEEADLDGYFGVTKAPYLTNPGIWEGSRGRAAELSGAEYTGGTYHARFGKVVNGSLEMPSFNFAVDGATVTNVPLTIKSDVAQAQSKVLVPFTLYLCKNNLTNLGKVPVAIFQHGGGAIRADGVAYANANCTRDVATIVIDMVFHGGRRKVTGKDGMVVPTDVDHENSFSGLKEGDVGYVPDHIGDSAAAAASVAGLFALGYDIDPLIVESNLLTIVAENYTLLHYLQNGDWTGLVPGLTFDKFRIFHESLSFGTSFSTALIALVNDFAGVVGSVGSSYIFHGNLPMAPSNAVEASAVVFSVLGLKSLPNDLQAEAHQDVPLSILGWLAERGDSHPYAPYILRHRPKGALPQLLHSGDSWDETLYGPAQTTLANAIGLQSFTAGADWTPDATMPGFSAIDAGAMPTATVSNNVTFNGKTTTAGIFWFAKSCHAEVLVTLCAQSYEHPYPPIKKLATSVAYDSPICGLHGQVKAFLGAILDGEPAVLTPPTATCDDVYSL